MKEIPGVTQKVEDLIKEQPGLNPNQITILCESNSGVISKRIKKLTEESKIIGKNNLPITTGKPMGTAYFHHTFFKEDENYNTTTKRMVDAFKATRKKFKQLKS